MHCSAILNSVSNRCCNGARGIFGYTLQPYTTNAFSLVTNELQPIAAVNGPALVAIAAWVDGVRLIDNIEWRPRVG